MSGPNRSSLLAAALALPGLAATVPQAARAEAAPTAGEVSVRMSHYQEFQPNSERMKANVPALFVLLPLGDDWAFEALLATDSVSGASPIFHDTLSGASGIGIDDLRRSADVEVTRYFGHWSLAVGGAYSEENDYRSTAARVVASLDTDDRNRTWTIGLGKSNDSVDSVNDVAQNEGRHTTDAQLGVTQVLTPRDVVQASVTFARGRGYYDDPYKPLDFRPDSRDQRSVSLRWNHFVAGPDAALRLNYRFYDDSWDVTAHSLDVAWEQPLDRHFAKGWAVTPSARYYTQSAAFFYADPPFGSGFDPDLPYSADTRLSAFGAWTVGVELSAPLAYGWTADVAARFYRQKSDWRWFGDGSPGIEPLSARIFEFGFKRSF